jgi:hypothetical protein
MAVTLPVRYAKRPGSRIAVEDAQAIGEALEQVLECTGELTPPAVVEAAEPEDHPLHGYFEWDNDKAAYAHRLQQARRLIRSVVIAEDNGEDSGVPAFLSLSVAKEDEPEEDEESEQHRVYLRIEDVMSDEDLRQRSLKELVGRVYAFRSQLAQYHEARALVKALDALYLKLDAVLW